MTDSSKRSRGALLLTSMCLAVLTACGGGDDPVVAAGPAPVVTPAVAVVTMPAAGTSSGVLESGSLNYLVYSPGGGTRPVPAVVDYNGTTGVGSLTLEDLVLRTTNGWGGGTWPADTDGLLALNGNAGLICDTTDNSGQVGVTGNLKQVLDLTVLRGKSFVFKACANGAVADEGGIVFNQDGSAQFTDADGVFAFAASDVAAYFSEAGWSFDGGVFKARAFSRTTPGGTEYVILDISNDVAAGQPINTVSLLIEGSLVAPK